MTGVCSVLLLVLMGLAAGGTHAVVSGDAGLFWPLVATTVAQAPAVLLLAGFAVLLVGWAPHRAVLAWVPFALALVQSYLGELLSLPGWLAGLSRSGTCRCCRSRSSGCCPPRWWPGSPWPARRWGSWGCVGATWSERLSVDVPPGLRMSAMPTPDVVAAGAVVIRKARSGRGKRHEVLLVHRPRYDDWSFPKGKLDRGEHVTACAVREVEEETGLRIRLGPPLPDQQYPVAAGLKTVHYWVARVVGDDDVRRYVPNAEIDRVAWVPWDKVPGRLTYEHDRETLAAARPLRRRTKALVVLRHAEASPRKAWRGDDRRRPLAGRDRPRPNAWCPSSRRTTSRCSSPPARPAASRRSRRTPGRRGPTCSEREGLSEEDASESTVARIAG